MNATDTPTDTRSLRTRVEVMCKARDRYDAAVLMEKLMAAFNESDASDLNPDGHFAAWRLSRDVRAVTYSAWKRTRDDIRQWGADARATETTVENALGVRYADTMTSEDWTDVRALATEWSIPLVSYLDNIG